MFAIQVQENCKTGSFNKAMNLNGKRPLSGYYLQEYESQQSVATK